jgi:hypothetical protein
MGPSGTMFEYSSNILIASLSPSLSLWKCIHKDLSLSSFVKHRNINSPETLKGPFANEKKSEDIFSCSQKILSVTVSVL